MKKLFLGLAVMSSMTYAINLTPNQIKNGAIPSGHKHIDLAIYNGNWTNKLALPSSAKDKDSITIVHTAGYDTVLDLHHTRAFQNISELTLSTNTTTKLVYNGHAKVWQVGNDHSMNPKHANIPAPTSSLETWFLYNGAWTSKITLPASAINNSILIFKSTAAYGSSIMPGNVYGASAALPLNNGDYYAFKFNTKISKWLMISTKPAARGALESEVVKASTPRTDVYFYNGNWRPSIALPAQANNGYVVSIHSSATYNSTISNRNVDFQGTMTLAKGDSYQFVYSKDKNSWIMTKSPTRKYSVSTFLAAKIGTTTAPDTEIYSYNGNWTSVVTLPSIAKVGDKILVKSTAGWAFNVQLNAGESKKQRITTGDSYQFVFDENEQWVSNTNQIKILMVSRDKVVDRIGKTAAMARLYEAYNLTNEALLNSDTKAQFKWAGWMKHTSNWDTLGDVLAYGRDDKKIQKRRNRLKADSVYYENDVGGCGLGYLDGYRNKYNMMGSGTLGCGTTVMRHELGHNLGIGHGDTDGANGLLYARGKGMIDSGTVMGGNSIPYYSSSKTHGKYGEPLGERDSIDAARAIREHSKSASKLIK